MSRCTRAPHPPFFPGDCYQRLPIVFDPGETISMDTAEKLGRKEEIAKDYRPDKTVRRIKEAWR
jgi:hypothetical protein